MTAIATVIYGDFDYLDEWIQYHLNIGVDLILIAYNGESKNYHKLPIYHKVKYFDFSYDKDDRATMFSYTNHGNSGSNNPDTSLYDMTYEQRIMNVLYDIVRYTYPNIHYLTFINTSEFIMINNAMFNNNINTLFEHIFPEDNSSYFLCMLLYHDNNLIYYDGQGCLERFVNYDNFNADLIYSSNIFSKKIVINLFHDDVKENRCKMLSAHHCDLSGSQFSFPSGYVTLAKFYSKTIEEWIIKMKPDNTINYFEYYKGRLVYEFFRLGNEITDEKLRAIPGLLKKHGIDYHPEYEETDTEIREKYKKANNIL